MKPQQILIGALLLSAAGLGAFLAFGGGQESGNVLSGYIEGEPLYPASPVAGRLVALGVQRGDVVGAGATFFSVDPAQTQAARDQALAEAEAAKSLAADAQRGQRPAELGVIEAQLAHAVKDANGRAYNRTKYLDQRRQMMQQWADFLDLCASGKTGPALPRSADQRQPLESHVGS